MHHGKKSLASWSSSAIEEGYKPVAERVKTLQGVRDRPGRPRRPRQQAARCMDCGTPFCNSGCPVNNIIPGLQRPGVPGRLEERASTCCTSTNNFPEFTGRICPAPCEAACTLNVNDDAGGHQVDRARHHRPRLARGLGARRSRPKRKTGKKVAVVGSGPAGHGGSPATGARAGHAVTLFEKNDRVGGLLRYGIPDFKMEKSHIDRRVSQMRSRRRHLPHRRAGGRACPRTPRSPTGPRKPSARTIAKRV